MSGLKVLVVSTKGGVGKSTVAMQLVAPYLYEKNSNRAIKYYECDDTNKDINSYGATSLIKRSIVNMGSPLLTDELFNIVTQAEPVCIDVGGNNTAKALVNVLNESGSLEYIDLVLIPTLDGEQDMINALTTYQNLKSMKKDIKIIFVLNRVKNRTYVAQQFDHFFGDSRGIFKNFLEAKKFINSEELTLYTMLVESDVIRYSRRFGLTVYEIAKIEASYVSELARSNDPKVASFKHFMSKTCQKYHNEVLRQNFSIIDKKLRREQYESLASH